ncbi:allophanate hydrolase [Glycomyces algeriensis]|uniref:Allophanate hydrolase n=1 Tax=Glycomyces algeriensis TaxID=256037 RepID=A0A9W6GBF2_9ACTN|nr:allophanate hydrolase [Glycomyces algeriensis]MDA1367415.1 allophanate hydrolase [Glycomyces algeriensis]MDR7350931.1 allophanate hydrolase [Glycomyces algeriensis]GLI43643.1 allophanate hydrolase [Glycomyces algeriensis]
MNTSAVHRVRAAIARLARADRPEAWITLRGEDDLLAEAARIDTALAAGQVLPLAGTVFAAKDNIDVAGLPTTAAAPSFAYTPERDATAVARLRAAGAICLGKTNLDQFATGLVGTRSPYGAVRSAADPDLISGGSSSGSAVVVALGIADFALGTDTAGSGRVPAALNGLIGIKATLGLVPVDGVVPACASYDCLTVFAPGLDLAVTAMRTMAGPSPADPASRPWPADAPLAAPPAPRIAVPRPEALHALDPAFAPLWTAAVDRCRDAGATVEPIDVQPLLDAALLLYEGALVAERFAAFGTHLDADDTDPTVAAIVRAAVKFSGADLAADQQRLRAVRRDAAALLAGFDALLLPTAPLHPRLAEVAADPIGVNARMGTYTNFVNLLDMAAVALPAGTVGSKGFGVSLIVPAFADQVAIDLTARLQDTAAPLFAPTGTDLVVFGAHLTGMPLNHQLTDLGARYQGEVRTAGAYRMYALDTAPPKPLVIRDATGASLPGERWRLSPAALGRFLAALPAPMTLGAVELDDGTWATGFCANAASGTDITAAGGWRAHRQ